MLFLTKEEFEVHVLVFELFVVVGHIQLFIIKSFGFGVLFVCLYNNEFPPLQCSVLVHVRFKIGFFFCSFFFLIRTFLSFGEQFCYEPVVGLSLDVDDFGDIYAVSVVGVLFFMMLVASCIVLALRSKVFILV